MRARLKLFDDIERTDASPATEGEDSFSFLNRAKGVVWERIRSVLDEWFTAYPANDAADLRGRFRSKLPGQHHSAWWELYLHRVFTRLGFEIETHPELPDTTSRPDFLLRRDSETVYLEAAVVFSGVVDETRDAVREGWIIDAINRGASPNFHVRVAFGQVGEKRPKARAVYEPIVKWLETLDPDQVAAEHASTGKFPELPLELDDWIIYVEGWPIDPERRGIREGGRLVGVGPIIAGFVNDKQQIRDTFKHKRAKYGDPSIPFVVAMNCLGSFPHDEDIRDALYGSVAYRYQMDRPGSGRPVRLRDGVWISDHGPRGRRMSAVLAGVQISSHTLLSQKPAIWRNPWAQVPMAIELPFTEWRCSENGLIERESREVDMADLLDLPPEWPGPEARFPR